MLFVGTSIIHPSTEGVFLLCNILDLLIYRYEYEIPETTWVIFENDGYFKESVQGVFRRFYTEWLPFSGYEYAGLPDIEVYPVVEDGTIHGHSEVWIAIKKKEENI